MILFLYLTNDVNIMSCRRCRKLTRYLSFGHLWQASGVPRELYADMYDPEPYAVD